MKERLCPRCGKTLPADSDAAFCQYCGAPVGHADGREEKEAVQALLTQANKQTDPVKKHDLLLKALQEDPQSLSAAEELLLLGRLHERSPRKLDFSVIKSFLLNAYLEPEEFATVTRQAMRREIFNHPDLARCLALTEDENAFLTRYLTRLSNQFIELFLRGSSRYMRRFFGMGLESRAPKLLAPPAAKLINEVRADQELTAEQRSLLTHAFYNAFSSQMGGDTQWLDQAMAERGIALE